MNSRESDAFATDRLAEALAALAAESPRQAPDRVEQALVAAFRDARRERSTPGRLPWGAWAAAALLVAAGAWLSSPAPAPPEVAAPPPAFIPLPGAPPPPVGDLYIARIRATRAALIAAGVPMNMERAGEPVQADVVFTLDGTPRAIRILQPGGN